MSHRLLILVALFVVVAMLLFIQLPVPPTYAGRTIENAGHLPVFFLITLGLLIVLRSDFKIEGARQYLYAGLLGTGLGLISEIIQRPLSRDASWEDVFSDVAGTLTAIALYALFDRRTRIARGTRVFAFAVALCCIVFYLAPLVRMATAYMHRNSQFPVLADFRSDGDLVWIVGDGVNRAIERDALAVEFARPRYPGIALYEPFPDWRGYQALVIDLENPDDSPFRLTVRVHDRGHSEAYTDRFNRQIDLAPRARRTIRIPLVEIERAPKSRLMNMRHISDIRLFRNRPEGAGRLRIYSLRLE